MNIYCDDGSTNVKLAWFEGDELQTRVSANSFRHGWKVAEFSAATFNYQVGTLKYTWDSVSRDAIPTTNVEYQYGDLQPAGRASCAAEQRTGAAAGEPDRDAAPE